MDEDNFEFGFGSTLWMARALIWNANDKLLRLAVNEVLNYLWVEEDVEVGEIFERIVQISATGKYTEVTFSQEDYEEAVKFADEIIERNIDEEVAKFREQLDNLGGETDDNA